MLDDSLGWILDLIKEGKRTPNEKQSKLARSSSSPRAFCRDRRTLKQLPERIPNCRASVGTIEINRNICSAVDCLCPLSRSSMSCPDSTRSSGPCSKKAAQSGCPAGPAPDFRGLLQHAFLIQILTALGYPLAGGPAVIWCTLVFLAILGNYLGNLRPTPILSASAHPGRSKARRLGVRLIGLADGWCFSVRSCFWPLNFFSAKVLSAFCF